VRWNETRLFHRIADWQSKPVTSYKEFLIGWLCLGLVLMGVFFVVTGPTAKDRIESLVVTVVAFAGSLWLLHESKA
jgi:hypothetical protein